MSKLLKITEQARLSELESTIERTKTSFVECGKALAEIRDSRLYRKTHDDFESYCKEKFGWVRSYANRLIKASTVSLETNVSKRLDKPLNASQALVLADVPEEKRAEVIEAAGKTGSVTAKSLGKAKEIILAPAKKEDEPEILDASGYPVPAPAMATWARRDEAKKYVQLISDARSAVRNLIAEHEAAPKQDILYIEVNLKSVLAELSNAYTEMNLAVPRLVCGVCQGQTPKTCMLCKGRGVISKNKWDLCVPIEIKEIRKKSSRK